MKSELRSCQGKAQLTRDDAERICREIRCRGERARNRKHHNVKAYKCQWCGYWHVGHNGAPKHRNYKRARH